MKLSQVVFKKCFHFVAGRYSDCVPHTFGYMVPVPGTVPGTLPTVVLIPGTFYC